MKITIIGWYGTETIGDRAILAGLISFFNKAFGEFDILLGSLYPFFSKRTIDEDTSLYQKYTAKRIGITIFDSKNPSQLDAAVRKCDLVVMGGGPLMDLEELYMIEYAFKKARRSGIKTVLLGCGVGPLFHKKYRKAVFNISRNSSLTILRDSQSKSALLNIWSEFEYFPKIAEPFVSFDPAVECALQFKRHTNSVETKRGIISVNLRRFPIAYTKSSGQRNFDKELSLFISQLSEEYVSHEIKLIPMHYFHVGDDDRLFLNQISFDIARNNVVVQNGPLSLEDTMRVFQSSLFTIGMRFHAIVLQTLLNGRNFIIDYTEPFKGKISGFLKDIDANNFYSERYVSLQRNFVKSGFISNISEKFIFDSDVLSNAMNIYPKALKEL